MYLYEMHSHTAEGSKCACIAAEDQVRLYYSLGFDGICITDHFLNGNTTVPGYYSYKERVERFTTSYKRAAEVGETLGIQVFLGWEYGHGGTDLLTYGLDEKWLLENPQIMEISPSEYCNLVRDSGGYIVQAHPFREAGYIDHIRLFPRHVDGVEVFNACRNDFENEMAKHYAMSYKLPMMAGSDNHWGNQPRLGAMAFDERQTTVTELLKNIIKGNGKITNIPLEKKEL